MSIATNDRKACTQGQVRPVLASSPRTSTMTSTLERKAEVILASRRMTCPTRTGPSKDRSSIPAVTATVPQWRWAQMAAATSIQARTCPPNTFPMALAWVGSTISVIVVWE